MNDGIHIIKEEPEDEDDAELLRDRAEDAAAQMMDSVGDY